MYVYTIEDFGSSGFTEITSITIHRTLRTKCKDTKKSRSRRHENKLAPLPPPPPPLTWRSSDWGKGDGWHLLVLQYCIMTNRGLHSVQNVIELFKRQWWCSLLPFASVLFVTASLAAPSPFLVNAVTYIVYFVPGFNFSFVIDVFRDVLDSTSRKLSLKEVL